MAYSIYWGCIAPLRYPDIERSARLVAEDLKIELIDIPESSCCPPGGIYFAFDKILGDAITARNLALGEKIGEEMAVACSGCFGTLNKINLQLKSDEKLREQVNESLKAIDLKFEGTIEVRHLFNVIADDIGLQKIKEKVVKPLTGLRVALHYGCHYLRPSEETGTEPNPYAPIKMKRVMEALGAEVVHYRNELMCCGAGGGVRGNNKELSDLILAEKLDYVKEVNADCLVVICPYCHLQFDLGQDKLISKVPIFYLTQLMALAFGHDQKEVAAIARTPRTKLLERIMQVEVAPAVTGERG